MKDILNAYYSLIFKVALLVTVLASFFLLTNLTTEFYDTPKFLVLLVFTALFLILLTLKFTLQNKITFIRTPLDLPLLLLLVVGIVATFLSASPTVSLLGNQGRIFASITTLTIMVLFYFVLTNSLKNFKNIKLIFDVLLLGGVVLSILSLLSYFGLKYLPAPWNQGQNFTPTGLSFSTSAILALLLPFPIMQILSSEGLSGFGSIKNFLTLMSSKLINSLLILLFGITLVLTGDFASWIGAVTGLVLVVTANKTHLSNWTKQPESFANLLVTLINLDCYLLDRMIRVLEQKFITEGGYSENLFKKRLEQRDKTY